MRIYCHHCGAKYVEGKEQPWICSNCDAVYYDNPRPATDIALFNEQGEVLISERAIEPAKGQFNLPGGFTEKKETLEQGAQRELQEELALKPEDYTALQYVCSMATDYPFKNECYDLVVPIFCATVLHPEKIQSLDDSASVRFVTMDELDAVDFSVDEYPDIIRRAHAQMFGASV